MAYTFDAEIRTDLGKGASRRQRRENKVPAVVYGGGKDAVSISLDHDKIFIAQQFDAFYKEPVTLNIKNGDQTETVQIGISLFKLETPYADPHVRCCERCDAKTSAYSIAPTLEFFLLTIAHFLPSLFFDAVSSCHLLHLQAYRIISLKLYYLRKIFYICCLTAVFSLLKTVTFCVGSILCYDALSWLKM